MKGVTPDQEENLLQQLTEITRVMQVGQLVEGVTMETNQKDWDGKEDCSKPASHLPDAHMDTFLHINPFIKN